jgi:dTDP-4-amino-4,6-dideoxygalactose transaminase
VNDDYSHDAMGYNYRMSNLHAALGLAQLEKLDRFIQAKQQIAEQYQQALAAVPGVTCHPTLPGCQNAYWLFSILVPPGADATDWIKSLQQRDIGARSFFKPLHRQAYLDRPVWTWQDRHAGPAWTGCADQLFQRGINLPSSVTLRREEQQLVIDAVLARGRNEKPCCRPNVPIA